MVKTWVDGQAGTPMFAADAQRLETALAYLNAGQGTPDPPQRIPTIVLDRFQSGHGWGSATGVTQASNDTTVLGLGTQSMKLTTQANTFGFTRKTAMTSRDITNYHPRIWLTIEDISLWGAASISVLAAPTGGLTGSSYFSWQVNLDTSANSLANAVNTPSGQMVAIDLPWASVFTQGSPAKTAIVDWQINVNAANTAGLNFWVHGLDLVPNMQNIYPNGVVTICLDDAYASHWTYARPAMSAYGYPATLFPVTGRIDGSGALTLAQLKTLQDVLGWEVGAHASTQTNHDNYNSMTQAQVLDDMIDNVKWLRENGFRVRNYAYPQGTFTTMNSDALAQRMFRSARSINPTALGALPPSNPWRLKSRSGVGGSGGFAVTTSGTTGTYGLLSAAKAGSSWVILTIHDISAGASGSINQISSADFTSLINSINGLGMEVATIDQVLAAIR